MIVEMVCASYVFGSIISSTVEVINEPLTELNGTVEVLEIFDCNISRCVLPSSEIIDRRLTPNAALSQKPLYIQQIAKTFKFKELVLLQHIYKDWIIDYYKIQGKIWMSNTHIGPNKRRVQFYTAFCRRWPLTLTVAAAGIGCFGWF